MPESRAALPEYFLVSCRVDQSLLTGYPQRDTWTISETDAWFLRLSEVSSGQCR